MKEEQEEHKLKVKIYELYMAILLKKSKMKNSFLLKSKILRILNKLFMDVGRMDLCRAINNVILFVKSE